MDEFVSLAKKIYLGLDPYFVGSSITDSFTLLVGFVAIGIPLSLQVISSATAKYKSAHLINYLTTWKLVTPKRIYWSSILYFISALAFKSRLPTKPEECQTSEPLFFAWLIVISFLALVVLVGLWYGHLFSLAGKRPKEIYDALKK